MEWKGEESEQRKRKMFSFQTHQLLGFHEVMCGFHKWKPNINLTFQNELKPSIFQIQ